MIKKHKIQVVKEYLQVSSSFVIKRIQTVATFKVKADVSLLVKCKEMK